MSEHVILLHGLARTARSMRGLARSLSLAGYVVHNCDYHSTQLSIEEAAMSTLPKAIEMTASGDRVHIVTHSLGGLLVRYYLRHHSVPNLGRVVMLSPPNQGSEIADWLQPIPPFHRIFGPVLAQLGTGDEQLPAHLGPANFELGIIAGTRALNFLFYALLAKPNDGTVSVERTKLSGMCDHLCLPATHPLIMKNKQTIAQVLHFLRHGRFSH